MEEENKNSKDEMTWDVYVKTEVIAYLNHFLPKANAGVVGIRYIKPTTAVYESGPIKDDTKAIGVQVITEFSFDEPIDITETEE